MKNYLNFGPSIQSANVALDPEVIFSTLWLVKDGNITAEPGLKFSIFTSPSLNKYKSPPWYSSSEQLSRQVTFISLTAEWIEESMCQVYS